MKKLLIVIAGVIVLLTGCKSEGSHARKQSFTYYEATEIQSIDPAIVSDDAGFNIVSNSFEGLFGYNQNNELVPLGAVALPSETGTHFEIQLRKEAKWSNGSSVTAQDYLSNFKRVIALDSPYKTYYKIFKNGQEVLNGSKSFDEIGIKAKDDYTLVFDLTSDVENFTKLLTLPIFFPICTANIAKDGNFNDSDTLVYNGPFVVKGLKIGENFSWGLVKNKEYWDKTSVQLTKINGRVIKDNGIRLGNYNAKKASLIPITKVAGRDISQDPEYQTTDYYQTGFILLNQETDIFKEKKIRQMVYLGTNREEVVDWALNDFSQPSLSILPLKESSDDFKEWGKSNFDYDIEKVKSMYEDYSKANTNETRILRIITPSKVEYRKIAESLQFALEKAVSDFQITIEMLSPSEFTKRFAAKDYELAVCQSLPTVQDDDLFAELLSSNFLTYSLSSIPEQDLNQYVEDEIIANHWIDPLYQTRHSYLVSSKLKGVQLRNSAASLYFKNGYLVN